MSINIKETLWAKPTKPTHHSPIILSNNDIVIPKIYILGHYFFKNVDNKSGFMDVRKIFSSLEDILTDYYPLAGRLKDEPDGRVSIVRDDQGIPFIVANSPDITIRKLEERNWENSSIPERLLPVEQKAEPGAPLLAVKHTTLADGSVVLGVAVHHSVTDGNGIFAFLENWGRKARNEPFTPPVHDRSLLKSSGNPPSKEHPEFMVLSIPQTTKSNNDSTPKVPLPQVVRKIFYFSRDNLKKLQNTYSSKNPNDTWISTNDALVAHISRTAARARGIPLDELAACGFACDGRKKFHPPLPPSYFGNAVLTALPRMPVSELINGSKSNIALNVRRGHTEIDSSKARSSIDWIEQQQDKHKIFASINPNKDYFITNWSKFPIYDLNFGYGTPIKFRLQKNTSYFGGTSVVIGTPADDGGLEIYVNLASDHMQKLEQDPEFKMFQ